MVIKVRPPLAEELATLKPGTVLVGMLNPHDADGLQKLATTGASAFALEAAPRTTRAQSMDVLSSQANIAGYKAVLLAAPTLPALLPDDDDGGRHGEGGAGGRAGRRRGGPAGDRNGEAAGRA